MEDNKDYLINEIVYDLETKVNGLNVLLSKADDENKEEVKKIVIKTSDVLRNAVKLLADTSDDLDYSELKNNADFVKNRSNVLYEDAIVRIKEVIGEKSNIDISIDTMNSVLFENVSNDDKLSQDSISILRTWIRPEEIKK